MIISLKSLPVSEKCDFVSSKNDETCLVLCIRLFICNLCRDVKMAPFFKFKYIFLK